MDMKPNTEQHNTHNSKPTQNKEAKKAYTTYLKEGSSQGHAEHKGMEKEAQLQHAGSSHTDHHDGHAHMAADFRKRFWISLVLTFPILIFSPMLQMLVP